MKNVNRFTSCSLMLFMVLSTLGMMLTPVHKLESEISSGLLQYRTNGHVLGFTSEGMYAVSYTHLTLPTSDLV